MKIAYSETNLQNLYSEFAKGFKPPAGAKVIKFDTFLDSATGKVLFRLFVQEPGETEDVSKIIVPDRN